MTIPLSPTICSIFDDKSDNFYGGYLGTPYSIYIQKFIDLFSDGIMMKKDNYILPMKMSYNGGFVVFNSLTGTTLYNIRDINGSIRIGSNVIVESIPHRPGKNKKMCLRFKSVTDAIIVNNAFYDFSQGI